jgi:hypothetical protein
VVNKEVEQQFLGRGVTFNKRNFHSYFSKVNDLGKAAVLYLALFCDWGHAKLSLPVIGHS